MEETRDSTISLFGHKIPLSAGDRDGVEGYEGEQELHEEKYQTHEDPEAENVTERVQEICPPSNLEEAENSGNSSPEGITNLETPSIEEEIAKSKDDKSEKEQSQEKTLKKPDKLLPCPRCNSMDTKFCYYNNYNVNQPRYFCRACQRYWTAGGATRNVPVGAGRRKNKNSTSHYNHITISEALQEATMDSPNGTHIHSLKSNGRVISFGSDAPICDSMASVQNTGEKKVVDGTINRFHGLEDQRLHGENGDEYSSVSNSVGESNKSSTSTFPQSVLQNNGFLPQLPCMPNVPWPYTWNSQVPPPHGLCPLGFSFPIYPPTFWNVPWFPSHSYASSSKSPSSGPNSPTLGKHSRDGEQDSFHKEEPLKHRNGRVLVPKTLRIDDPSEAAKSSIWTTLGIKNESASRGGMFKAFQSKRGERNGIETSSVLMANPAALSRSLNFHENF